MNTGARSLSEHPFTSRDRLMPHSNHRHQRSGVLVGILSITLSGTIASGQAPPSGGPPGFRQAPPGGPDGPDSTERPIVDQFDEDGNGRLTGAELDAARTFLKENPAPERRRGGPGGRGGRGGRGPGGASAETGPGPRIAKDSVEIHPDRGLFDPDIVRTIFLDFDAENWEEELELFHGTDVDVPATMTVDGRTYEGVGVHFRGASSYLMVPRGTKRSLAIAVDHTDPDADLGGQNSLNLLNSNGDPSMLSTSLYARLAESHLPTPRANHVHLVVNGESWGVYVNAEQFNRAFLREHWPDFDGEGARWKVKGSPRGTGGLDFRGEDLEAYRERYEIKTRDREKHWSALIELCRAIDETPIEDLEETLRPMLDLDGAMWFIALDVATSNTDGYWVRSSDYSIYLDPEGVFHLVPHDMNEAFKDRHRGPGGRGGMRGRGGRGPGGPPPGGFEGGPGRGGPPMPPGPGDRGQPQTESLIELDPMVAIDDPTKPLRSRLLRVPSLKRRYLENLRTIAEEMSWANTGPFVIRQRELLEDLVAADTRKATSAEAFLKATSSEPDGDLRRFLDGRSRFLAGESSEDPEARDQTER